VDRAFERSREPPSSNQFNAQMSGIKLNRFDHRRTVDAISSGRNSQCRPASIGRKKFWLNSKLPVRDGRNKSMKV